MSDRAADAPAADRRSVLALIPALDEAETIGDIVERVGAQLPVLVIDDGSTDGTADIAREAGAEIVRHPTNQGKGAALKTGFAWALERDYGYVLTIDADGQHDPADVGSLVAAAEECEGGLAIGERTFSEMPWPRWWTTPLGARLLSIALGARITDNQSGFRLLSRRFLERLDLEATGYEMEVEMIGEAVRLGAPIVWVPIRTIYFAGKKPGFRPFVDTVRLLGMMWRLWRRRKAWERERGQAGDDRSGR